MSRSPRSPTTDAGALVTPPASDEPNGRIYIHEFVDIAGPHRAEYLHHMAANWSPLAQETRNQKLFGMWAVLGSTGRWPQVVNLWEESSWDGLASSFAQEAVGAGLQDPDLERWWRAAAEFRSGGRDRLLEPAAWSPTIEQLTVAGGLDGACVAHDLIRVERGSAADHLDAVRTSEASALEPFGWRLIGALSNSLRDDDECVVLWSVPTWVSFAAVQKARRRDDALQAWAAESRDREIDRERLLLVDAPLSPLRTGRQPRRSDRTGWQD
jgi:hypothetical protein